MPLIACVRRAARGRHTHARARTKTAPLAAALALRLELLQDPRARVLQTAATNRQQRRSSSRRRHRRHRRSSTCHDARTRFGACGGSRVARRAAAYDCRLHNSLADRRATIVECGARLSERNVRRSSASQHFVLRRDGRELSDSSQHVGERKQAAAPSASAAASARLQEGGFLDRLVSAPLRPTPLARYEILLELVGTDPTFHFVRSCDASRRVSLAAYANESVSCNEARETRLQGDRLLACRLTIRSAFSS